MNQITVAFYEDEIIVVTDDAGQRAYVPLRPMTELLGLSWRAMRRTLQNDPILSEQIEAIPVLTQGGPQEMTALPLDYLQGWLFKINASRVKDEVRDRVLRYQRECYQVLHNAFSRVPSHPLSEVEAMGYAIARMAREQIEMDTRLTRVSDQVGDLSARVLSLEARAGEEADTVTEEQASQISQAVKAVALALGKRSGRNEYGGVYGELYRKFGVTSYKSLPRERFREAMAWLTEWYEAMQTDTF